MNIQPQAFTAGDLRLNFNENTAGCSPVVLDALRSIAREQVALYPDYTEVTARLEQWFGVERGWVQITNGLDEGIQMTAQCGAWHFGPRPPAAPEVIIVEPAFEVYELCADAVGARIVKIPPAADFRFPTDALLASVTPSTRVIYLTDPNNPTGLGIPAGAVEAIAAAAPQALVLIDEAYSDFSGRTLVGRTLEQVRNVIIGKTFAKAHGLAALRVGALIAHPDTLNQLRRVQLPFSVNISATTALSAALGDRAFLDWYVAESAASREAIYSFCRSRGLTFWPSEANFVLFRAGDSARSIVEALEARRIFVRDKSRSPGCDGCLRLTAGVLAHTRIALSALEDILAPRPN